MEVDLEELPRAANDNPVIAEKQAAECGDKGDAPDISGGRRGVRRDGSVGDRRAMHGQRFPSSTQWLANRSRAAAWE